MPEQLMPETRQTDVLVAAVADLNRRLQILEGASRVGLNRVRFAWTTHTGTPRIAAADVWETGPASATWEDDQGNTGTGYPELTLVTGRKALFFTDVLGLDYANDAAYKVGRFSSGVGIDGLNPVAGWSGKPNMLSTQTRGPVTEGTDSQGLQVGRNDLTPGEHTFRLWGLWQTQFGGATMPYMSEGFLAIVPID